ncbi:transposase [Deinococcus sp. QL22]|uniref:transposase n=1 Tax=Deinococcus sp. QL22 TaxID=2939437 RepID=UPI00352FF82E
MNPKEPRSRRLYSDILTCFSRAQHRASFEVFLDLLLDGSGRPLPERATVKSPAAISRFLNHAAWQTRQLCRVMRQHALQLLPDEWRLRPHQRPRLDLLVDLTSLEKSGKFADLDDWMHTFNSVHGVHLVVLYLCCGQLRLPWAVQVWRGKGTPSPAQLALKLLRTVARLLLSGRRRPRLHADGGFESVEFIQGVLAQGLDIVVGVRCTRKLEDGRQVQDLMVRGSLVKPCGLDQIMCLLGVALPEQGARTTLCHVQRQSRRRVSGTGRERALED